MWNDSCRVQLMGLALFGMTHADWPQYQHDARRPGFTAEEIHPPYKVAWRQCFLPNRVAAVQSVIATWFRLKASGKTVEEE